MTHDWKETEKEPPIQAGWYFVSIDLERKSVALRSLSIQRSSDGENTERRWDLGEKILGEELLTYRYWMPVAFPQPPNLDVEESSPAEDGWEKREEMVAEAISNLNRLIGLLEAAAYDGDGGADIAKICCNVGRSMEIAIAVRNLLGQTISDDGWWE